MNLVIAVRLSTGWILGMVGTCTKFRYQRRPIHITPLSTCNQRMTNVAHAWSIRVVCPVTALAMITIKMSSTTLLKLCVPAK